MNSNEKTCPFCSEAIKTGASKCKHCGEWLNQQTQSSLPLPQETISQSMPVVPQANQQELSTGWKIAIAIGIIFILAVIFSEENGYDDEAKKYKNNAKATYSKHYTTEWEAGDIVAFKSVECIFKDVMFSLQGNPIPAIHFQFTTDGKTNKLIFALNEYIKCDIDNAHVGKQYTINCTVLQEYTSDGTPAKMLRLDSIEEE